MPTTPADEKVLVPEEEHSASFKNICVFENFPNTDLSASTGTVVQRTFLNPEKHGESLSYTRLFTPASARVPLARSLAHRKLRKYASETCFSLDATSITDLLPNDRDELDLETAAKCKVFSVRPVKSTTCSVKLGDGPTPSYHQPKREDSEGEASYSGSEATVASSSVTPILRHKSKRFRLNRPKSATQISGTPASSDVYNTLTSVTVRSIDSLQQIGFGVATSIDGRHDSSVYNLDDDSLHEFDDQKGKGMNDAGYCVVPRVVRNLICA